MSRKAVDVESLQAGYKEPQKNIKNLGGKRIRQKPPCKKCLRSVRLKKLESILVAAGEQLSAKDQRTLVLAEVAVTVSAGARLKRACAAVSIHPRTHNRWKASNPIDRRK